MLEYIKVRQKYDKECMVLDEERKVFETLKVIFEGNWIIHDHVELKNILIEIGILNETDIITEINSQLYYFVWYLNECLNFSTERF